MHLEERPYIRAPTSTFPLNLRRHNDKDAFKHTEEMWSTLVSIDPLSWSMNILWKWCTSMSKLSNSGYLYLPWLETDWSHCTGHAFSFKHYHSMETFKQLTTKIRTGREKSGLCFVCCVYLKYHREEWNVSISILSVVCCYAQSTFSV